VLKTSKYQDEVLVAPRVTAVSVATVLAAVAAEIQVEPASFAVKHSEHPNRDLAARLARRLTAATLRELAVPFGLEHPDSIRGLLNRATAAPETSRQIRGQVHRLEKRIRSAPPTPRAGQPRSKKHEKRTPAAAST
jgi:hypothetical protein